VLGAATPGEVASGPPPPSWDPLPENHPQRLRAVEWAKTALTLDQQAPFTRKLQVCTPLWAVAVYMEAVDKAHGNVSYVNRIIERWSHEGYNSEYNAQACAALGIPIATVAASGNGAVVARRPGGRMTQEERIELARKALTEDD
jgi:hypothetical protein